MSYQTVLKQKYRQKGTKIMKTLSAGSTGRAKAVLLLSAKASAVVGDKVGIATISQQVGISAGRTPAIASGPMEDAILLLHRVLNGVVLDTATVKIKNMSTTYADPNVVGKVNWQHADIQAIGATHYDSNGVPGWLVYDGVFAEAPAR